MHKPELTLDGCLYRKTTQHSWVKVIDTTVIAIPARVSKLLNIIYAKEKEAEPVLEIKSGDRLDTGTDAARRPMTYAEAAAGGLPAPFTPAEWQAMRDASHRYGLRLLHAAAQEIGIA